MARAFLPLIILGSFALAGYVAVNYWHTPKHKRPEFSPGAKMLGYVAAGIGCVAIILTGLHIMTTVGGQL